MIHIKYLNQTYFIFHFAHNPYIIIEHLCARLKCLAQFPVQNYYRMEYLIYRFYDNRVYSNFLFIENIQRVTTKEFHWLLINVQNQFLREYQILTYENEIRC